MRAEHLSPGIHRLLDYVTIAIFAVAPSVLGFTGVPRILAYVLAVVHLAMTLATRFGAESRPVSLALHGMVELAVGVVLVVAALALGWPTAARVFFLAAGAVILLVWALTRYRGDVASA